jgi:dTDP-4-dehydrorhamnose 3,5-epimerase
MDQGWAQASIPGVWRRHLDARDDERGGFLELWRASLTAPMDETTMVQANLSRSRRGVLRGMHFHLRQSDLWLLIEGNAFAAVTDLRPAITGGEAVTELIDLAPGDALYIPRRVAHGFLARTDMALIYLVSNEYDGTDEHGFAWNDPAVGIDWPDMPTILSGRDQANPPLSDVIASLRHSGQIEPR